MDFKYMQDLARKIIDEDRAMECQMAQKITVTDKKRAELSIGVAEGKVGNQSKERDKIEQKKNDSNHVNARSLENPVVECFSGMDKTTVEKMNAGDQMERKEKSEHGVTERALGNQIVHDFSGTEKKRVEWNSRPTEKKIVGKQVEGKENEYGATARRLENEVDDLSGMHKDRFEQNARPIGKKILEKQMEREERKKHIKSENNGGKRKDRDWEKKDKLKNIYSDEKEKEKEEKMKGNTEPSKEQPKLKGSRKGPLDSRVIETSQLLRGTNDDARDGILGKGKKPEIIGYLYDNGLQPCKLSGPVSSSQLVMEHGRKLEPCQTVTHSESEMQGVANNHEVHIKEHRINGLKELQQHIICSTRPSSAMLVVYENGDTPEKLPHPDSKFLNQIFSLPKIEEWCYFVEQEWLFSNNCQKSRKSMVGSPGADGTQQVWAEAMQIEAADVFALPYGIPY